MIVSCQWREHTAKTKATDAHRRSWRWPPASRVRALMVHGKTTGPSINQSISQSICRKLILNCVSKIWFNLFQDCNISNNDFYSDDDFHNWSNITLEKFKKSQIPRAQSNVLNFLFCPTTSPNLHRFIYYHKWRKQKIYFQKRNHSSNIKIVFFLYLFIFFPSTDQCQALWCFARFFIIQKTKSSLQPRPHSGR